MCLEGGNFVEAKAYLRYYRISPRKVQIVLDQIRNKPVNEALAILKYTPKAASTPLLKLLNSAISNAVNNHDMSSESLYVSQCFVCPGPILKRIRPGSFGRAHRILKRSSHITMAVKERE